MERGYPQGTLLHSWPGGDSDGPRGSSRTPSPASSPPVREVWSTLLGPLLLGWSRPRPPTRVTAAALLLLAKTITPPLCSYGLRHAQEGATRTQVRGCRCWWMSCPRAWGRAAEIPARVSGPPAPPTESSFPHVLMPHRSCVRSWVRGLLGQKCLHNVPGAPQRTIPGAPQSACRTDANRCRIENTLSQTA